MATKKSLIVNLFVALVALMFAACSADKFNGVAEAPQTLVNPWGEPEDSTHVTLRDSVGRILVTGFNLGKYAEVRVEETRYADAKEAWKPAERLAKTVAESAETQFRFNHGVNTVGTRVFLVVRQDYYKDLDDGRVIRLKKGDIIPLYQPENLNLRGGEPATEETPGRLYYAETAVKYSLRYGEIVIAEGIQPFVAAEGFVPEFEENVMLDDEHVSVRAGQVKNNILPIYCTNRQLFAQKWNDLTLRDSTWVPFDCFNPFVLDLHEVKTDDFTKMQKVYTFDANGVTVINGVQQRVTREADASVVGSVKYSNVDYTGSVHVCWYDAKTLTLVSTDSADIMFQHREGLDKVVKRVGFKTTVVTLKEVLREFIHKAYRKKAIVSGTNVAAICDNDDVFQDLFTDGSKGKEVKGSYVGTNNLTLTMPDAVAREARGKSYNFTVDSQSNGTAAVEGKNVKLTFASWVVGDIMYNGKNYKNDPKVPTCKVIPASIYFRTDCDSADITVKHDKEVITATVKVPYEALPTLQEIVRSFAHGSFNTTAVVTGSSIKLTCTNPAKFYKLYSNGDKKDEKVVNFYEYNYFTYSQGVMPRKAKGNTYYFNGSNTINAEGKNVTVTPASPQVVIGDIMYDGTNYKNDPKVPECKATPYSAYYGDTKATYTFVHDSETITAVVDVTYEAETIDIPLYIDLISLTHSYQNQHGNYEGTYYNILGHDEEGLYHDLTVRLESFNPALPFVANGTYYTADDGAAIMNSGRAVALVWNGSKYLVGTVTSEDKVAAAGYFLKYYWHNQLAYSLGNGTGTHSQGETGYPNAILGNWTAPSADGTWPITIAGNTYNLRGLGK